MHAVFLYPSPRQAVSVLAVSPDGAARLWPSLAHEGTYTETHADLGGHLCNYVTAVRVSSVLQRFLTEDFAVTTRRE